MTYETVARFADTWGLVFLVLLFAIAVGYALWPGNRTKFKHAAHIPLQEDDLETPKEGPSDEEKSRV